MRLAWLEKKIVEFRGRHSGATASTPAPRCLWRAPRKERAGAVLPGVPLRGDSKVKIVDRVSKQPGSIAGDVAKGLDFERTVPGTHLVQVAESGELKLAARRYQAV